MNIPGLLHSTFICLALLILGSSDSCTTLSDKNEAVINKIIKVQSPFIPDSVTQLILVYNEKPEDPQAKLFILEKDNDEWNIVQGPVPAGIGENGFAAPGEKVEGDGKTPSGMFRLGHLFTYEVKVDTKMVYSQSTSEDKWIDDPESTDYNRHVRGETTAKSHENLKLKSDHYKYCMVIEYNTDPVVKGKGSAIFFHLRDSDKETTAGCIAISEVEMLRILKWLDPETHPMILMGNFDELIKGDFHPAK